MPVYSHIHSRRAASTAATVLVVEDNSFTRKVVERALRREGYQVVMVESGHAAIEQMSVCHPQLVLQDIALGDMDGRQLLGTLRKLAAPDVRFVAFTGGGDADELRTAGFDDVILKPVGLNELASAVHAQVRHQPRAHRPTPRTTDVWAALMTMLTQVAELSRRNVESAELEADILASILHACGLSIGLSFGVADGKLVPHAQVGVAPRQARALAAEWAVHHTCTEAMRALRPALVHRERDDLFVRTGIASLLVIPLHVHGEATAVVAVGSTGEPLPAAWLHFATAIAGTLATTLKLAATTARLAASEHRFRGLAASTADGILMTDPDGIVTYANAVADKMLGQPVVGRPITKVLDGKSATIESSARSFEDPPGQLNWVYLLRDVSNRQRMVELESLATRDAMTGLCNRRRFDEELASRLASSLRHGTPRSVLLIDLDRFKPINDTHGHAAGDAVLRAVGKTLAEQTRTSDLAARLGGDEFAIVLDHTGRIGAEACAAKLLTRLAELEVPYHGVQLTIGASIGIATFPDLDDRAEAVLNRADDALYLAKREGRGQAR